MKRLATGALLALALGSHAGVLDWLRDYCDPFAAADREFEAVLRRDAEEFERWHRGNAEPEPISVPAPTVALVNYVIPPAPAVSPDGV